MRVRVRVPNLLKISSKMESNVQCWMNDYLVVLLLPILIKSFRWSSSHVEIFEQSQTMLKKIDCWEVSDGKHQRERNRKESFLLDLCRSFRTKEKQKQKQKKKGEREKTKKNRLFVLASSISELLRILLVKNTSSRIEDRRIFFLPLLFSSYC